MATSVNSVKQSTKPEVSTLPQKDFMTTAMLSLFLGMLGIDRFYLGKIGTGILKLITFGGLGIWYLIDLIMILAGSMKSKNGQLLKDRAKHIKLALIITVVWFVVCIGFYIASPKSSTTTTNSTSNPPQTAQNSTQKQASTTPTLPGIGTAVRDGKFEFTVKSISCGNASVGSGYITETAQGQYCLLDLSVKNIGNEPQSLFAENQYIYNASNQKYGADSSATYAAGGSSTTWYSNINPGNSVNGIIVFDMPKDAVPSIAELHDSAYSTGAKVKLN